MLPPRPGWIHLHWLERGHGRDALKRVLGAYLGITPDSVVVRQADAASKPELGDAERLRFNWSHSGDQAVVAVATDIEVGIDIERADRRVRARALAQRFFAPAETDWLAGLAPAVHERAFLRIWTAKEAVLKALGAGIAAGLDKVTVEARPDGQLRLAALALEVPGAQALRLRAIPTPRQNTLASLAWLGPTCQLAHFADLDPLPESRLFAPEALS